MDEILKFASQDTGLPLRHEVKRALVNREQVGSYEERARGLGETERTLKDTLVTTQRLADEMKESAKRDAQLALREASLNAEKLMEEARAEEAKLRVEIQSLKRLRRQLIEELRATVERYDRTLSADLGGAGDADRSI